MAKARGKGESPHSLTRREFVRLTAGAALTVLLPGCRRAPRAEPLPAHAGLVDTTRFKKAVPWRLGRSGRGDTTSWMVMFSAHIEYGAKEKYKAHFADYWCTQANWDPNKQIEDIKLLLAQGIDLLLIDPLDHGVVQAGVEQATHAGVPVILASTRVQSNEYVSWVATNEEQRGTACADWLCQAVPDGHIVVLQSVPAASDSSLWLRGVRQRLDAQSSLHGVEVVPCTWASSQAQQVVASLLGPARPVAGVIVENGVLGLGVVQAFVERGLPIPPIAGVDDWNGWLRTAKEQSVRFLAQSGGANLGLRCVELATQILGGEPVPGYVQFPCTTFDAGALDRYYRPDLSDHYWAIHDLPETWIDRMFRPQPPARPV